MSADRMRERLRELGRASERGPEPALDARIAERVRQHGPAVVRRSRQRRTALRAAAMVLPLAVGVFAWRAIDQGAREGAEFAAGGAENAAGAEPTRGWREADRRLADSAREAPARDLNGARAQGAAVESGRGEGEARAAAAIGAACAQHPVTGSNVATLASGRRALDLGARGLAVLEKGAEVQLEAADPCRLELQLVRGRVTVHAKDLMGGELRVRAASTDVVVHGTTFAVERVADGVSVDVAEGAVAVEREGRAVTPLIRTGQRVQLAVKQAPVIAALSEEASAQLMAAVAEKVVLSGTRAGSSATLSTGASGTDADAAVAQQLARETTTHARSRRTFSAEAGAEDWGTGGGPSARVASETFGRNLWKRRGSRGSAAEASARTSARAGYEAQARSRTASDSESAGGDSSSEEAQAVGSDAWKRALAGSESARALAQAKPERSELSRPITSTYGDEDGLTAPQPSAAASEAAPGSSAGARTASDAASDSARAETPAELVARADRLWRSGSRDDARALYRRAGTLSGATAQAAWLALARRELSAGRSSAARDALDSYKARFPSGALSEEAAGIEFRIALLEHDDALAARLAQQLRDRHPGSPAAQAATRWLRSRGHTP